VLSGSKLWAGAIAAAALVAAGIASGTLAAKPSGVAQETTTTTTTLQDGSGCTTDQVAAIVRAVVKSFNAGHAGAVDRLFAPEPAFKWFAMRGPQGRIGKAAQNRTTIRSYVRKRHRRHDRLTLVTIQGNAHFFMRRRADDYHPRNAIEGKGAAICRHGSARLVVWAL
jgi:hypothetical protein